MPALKMLVHGASKQGHDRQSHKEDEDELARADAASVTPKRQKWFRSWGTAVTRSVLRRLDFVRT
jgi:hypothetical protein